MLATVGMIKGRAWNNEEDFPDFLPGTNINEALMRAVYMLARASNQGQIDPRSVSMIILVSDGDPTVGKRAGRGPVIRLQERKPL